MKRLFAGVITAVTLIALFVATAVRPGDSTDETGEMCLDRMFQAMRDGDVTSYLNCFSGPLRDQLEVAAKQQGVAAFAQYLIDTTRPMKGRSIFRGDESGSDRIRLKVDRVYENRMWEFQTFHLARESAGWKIVAIDPVELHEPPIPYGTPAAPELESAGKTN